jgi:hypothetical protein
LNYDGLKVVTLCTGQLAQLEGRNAEVESQNSALVQQNVGLQRVERELRDNLLTFVSHSELRDVQEKLRKSEQDRVCTPVFVLCPAAQRQRWTFSCYSLFAAKEYSHVVCQKFPDILEEFIASIFSMKEMLGWQQGSTFI